MKVFYKQNKPIHLNFISYIKNHQDINQENKLVIESYFDLKRKSEAADKELKELKALQLNNIEYQEFDKNKKFLVYKDAINYGIKELCKEDLEKLQGKTMDKRDLDMHEREILNRFGYMKDDIETTVRYVNYTYDDYHGHFLKNFTRKRILNAKKCIDENLFFIPLFAKKEDLQVYKKYLQNECAKEQVFFEFIIKKNDLNKIIYSIPKDPRIWNKIFFYDYLDTSKVVATWEFDNEEEAIQVYDILQKKLGQTTEEIIL